MTIPSAPLKSVFQHTARRAFVNTNGERKQNAVLTAELNNALKRELVLLRERSDLLQRQATLAQEFEHRLINSLQLIASLLSLQSRSATTPEATAQLTIAAGRVAALGRLHRRLHVLFFTIYNRRIDV